jgi:hypothetical protein
MTLTACAGSLVAGGDVQRDEAEVWWPSGLPQPDNPRFKSVEIVQSEHHMGSCFVVAKSETLTYFVTSRHIVASADEQFFVGYRPAVVVRMSDRYDLALLAVTKSYLDGDPLVLETPELEEEVWAVGFSRWDGVFMHLVHPGNVVVVMEDFTACHNGGGRPGMSGGPVFDEEGNAVGVTEGFARAWVFPNFSELCFVPGDVAQAFVMETLHGPEETPEAEESEESERGPEEAAEGREAEAGFDRSRR